MLLKWLKSATMVLAFWLSASAQASVSPGPITLQAHDGVSISALVYEVCLPQIKSGHIGGAIRPRSDGR